MLFGTIRGVQTAFDEKHGLLTQVHELTKSRRKAWHLSFILYLFLLLAILFAVTLQSPWILGKTVNIFMTRDRNHSQ
jgi:hypothetical protein